MARYRAKRQTGCQGESSHDESGDNSGSGGEPVTAAVVAGGALSCMEWGTNRLGGAAYRIALGGV